MRTPSQAFAVVILNKTSLYLMQQLHRFGAGAVRSVYEGRGSERRFNFKERRNLNGYLFRFYYMQTTGVAKHIFYACKLATSRHNISKAAMRARRNYFQTIFCNYTQVQFVRKIIRRNYNRWPSRLYASKR